MGLPVAILSLRLSVRLLLGLVLLSVGVSKLAHPRRFRRGIQDSQVIPPALESKLALSAVGSFCIPIAELLAGLGLVSGLLLVPAAVLALCLFALFGGALLVNLLRGRSDLSCHCGGALGDHRISWWLVGRNGLFMAGLLALLSMPADSLTIDTFVRRPSALSAIVCVNFVLPIALLVVGVLAALVLFKVARVVLRPQ